MRPIYSHNVNAGLAGTFPCFNPIPSASYNLPNISYPSNPYFYLPLCDPPFNPGRYASYNTAKRGNVVSNLVDNHQQIPNNNTNLFEEPSPFGSLNARFTATLTPPKSTENKTHNHEHVSWNNLDALGDVAAEQDNEKK